MDKAKDKYSVHKKWNLAEQKILITKQNWQVIYIYLLHFVSLPCELVSLPLIVADYVMHDLSLCPRPNVVGYVENKFKLTALALPPEVILMFAIQSGR